MSWSSKVLHLLNELPTVFDYDYGLYLVCLAYPVYMLKWSTRRLKPNGNIVIRPKSGGAWRTKPNRSLFPERHKTHSFIILSTRFVFHSTRGTGVSKLTIIGSDNDLSLGRCQAIIWTNAAILLIEHLGTKVNGIIIEIHTFSFKKIHSKMSSAKWQPFCICLNVLRPTLFHMKYWKYQFVKSIWIYICEMSSTSLGDQWVNSLVPSDAIWRWGSWSTLVQVMACCLTAPSHYLNQCWLIISRALLHSSEDINIRGFENTNQ